jgi:hypothetical protein
MPTPSTRRRLALAGAAAATISTGLAVHFAGTGTAAGFAADALYTVMVYCVLGLVLPRLGRVPLLLWAFGLSAAVELFQLTGVPAQLSAVSPAFRLLLGTTFNAPDLMAYGAGAAAAWGLDTALSAGTRTWRPSRSE